MKDIKFYRNAHPALNPYVIGLTMIFSRILWDLHPESWRSRKKVKEWKERFKGKKAVIVCNGPSLLKSDLTILNNTFTFGMNKINLLFDKSDFRPSCIAAVNKYVIQQNADFFNRTDLPLFIDSFGTRHVHSRRNVAFLHSSDFPRFAKDCSFSISQGQTVTFVAMELAFHMGFSDVALIGCDHDFTSKGPPNKTVTSDHEDMDHFDPNYFSGGVKWQLPDLLTSEVYYTLARNVYQQAGRRIVNATDGGKLEIFPRIPLKEFLTD